MVANQSDLYLFATTMSKVEIVHDNVITNQGVNDVRSFLRLATRLTSPSGYISVTHFSIRLYFDQFPFRWRDYSQVQFRSYAV